MTKKWIKLWTAESLRGTILFDFTPEERGVWYDLLAMAGESRHEGYIAPNLERGYPDEWIAATLQVPLKLLRRVIEKCEITGRIERTEFGLHIVNWSKYQSEYARQKSYRQSQKEKDAETVARLKQREKEAGHPIPRIKEEHEAIARHALGDKLIGETADAFITEEPEPDNPLAVPPEDSEKLNALIEETKAKP